jgi:hypothetical protein
MDSRIEWVLRGHGDAWVLRTIYHVRDAGKGQSTFKKFKDFPCRLTSYTKMQTFGDGIRFASPRLLPGCF